MKTIKLTTILMMIIISSYSQKITAPNTKLTQAQIEKYTISELYLLRNSIFAKYGRPFSTYELNAVFMKQGWYKPKKTYQQSDLSAIDVANVDLITNQENKLRESDYTGQGVKKVTVNNIYNMFQYPQFTSNELEKLSKNGFVVLPTDANQLFHIYENNDYLGIPSFISVDAMLQLYHLYFDLTLRNIESKHLSRKLETLLDLLIQELVNIQTQSKNPSIQAAIDFDLAYLAVSQNLIKGKEVEIHGKFKDLAKQEIEKCKNHSGFAESPLLNKMLDYSQYIPRGHYTRSEVLKNYFLAMMWLGNTGIGLEKDADIISSIVLTQILYNKTYQGKPLINLWNEIYEPTVFYVGLSDDTGPIETKKEVDNIFHEVSIIDLYNEHKKLVELAKRLPDKKIKGHGAWGIQKKQFRLMGQRFIPDSYIFDALTDTKRRMPNCLDIMAAFGNEKAYNLMMNDFKESWKEKPDYSSILGKLKEDNKNKTTQEWTQNLYYHWLYNLMSLYDIKDKSSLPFFMTTDGWETKTLNTALASWSELRHNTILYAQQSMVAECGGGDDKGEDFWIPEPPKGYVEPNVEFYNRMISLLNLTTDGLAKSGMMDEEILYTGKSFKEMLVFLKKISEKEIKKEQITLEEYDQIRRFGSWLDNQTLSVLTSEHVEWNQIDGPDKNMPVIADVHTDDASALEVAVGKAHEIYVIVEIEGKLKLTRGAIFSYYEFSWPSSDRLTDEKWQQMLESNKYPDQPVWINYKSEQKTSKKLVPLYKPSLQSVPESTTEPGWKFIYYDTGC